MRFLKTSGFGKSNFDAYGVFTSPQHKGILADIIAGKPWMADLGCLDGPKWVKKFDANLAVEWLQTMEQYRPQCLFIAGADVVGDAEATYNLWPNFAILFEDWPLAYVAQDGAEYQPIPTYAQAVFIGGSTEWKMSMSAVSVIKRAQKQRKHIHIGRVNWGRRYRAFRVLEGSQHFTCDGTRIKYDGWSRTTIDWTAYESQPPLLEI